MTTCENEIEQASLTNLSNFDIDCIFICKLIYSQLLKESSKRKRRRLRHDIIKQTKEIKKWIYIQNLETYDQYSMD